MLRLIILFCIQGFVISSYAEVSNQPRSKYNNFISPSSKSYFIKYENDQIFQIKLLTTKEELSKGFSGIMEEQVEDHQGLFFQFDTKEERYFWMPDTYFDLMIIYLDENLKIIDILKRAPHHPGLKEDKIPIFRAKPVISNFVLEFKADSAMINNFKIGKQFNWVKNSPPGFPQK